MKEISSQTNFVLVNLGENVKPDNTLKRLLTPEASRNNSAPRIEIIELDLGDD